MQLEPAEAGARLELEEIMEEQALLALSLLKSFMTRLWIL
jgi:hypothetical protein